MNDDNNNIEPQAQTVSDQGQPADLNDWFGVSPKNAQLNYILYFVAIVIGFSGVLALILAYINRGKGNALLDTHYTYQIHTFWIGLLFIVISTVLTFVLIGLLGFVATFVWFVVRNIKGISAIGRMEPIAKPTTWLW